MRHGYLRLSLSLVSAPRTIDRAWREWTEWGYALEIADEAECGSFDAFRSEVARTRWEYHHNFYRHSRYSGRHGDLEIVDEPLAGAARYVAVDGRLEDETPLAVTGLPAHRTALFPAGRTIRPRRISLRADCVATPFYGREGQILAADQGDSR